MSGFSSLALQKNTLTKRSGWFSVNSVMLSFLRDMFYGSCEAGDRVEEGQKQERGIDWESIRQVPLAVAIN